jgi:TPR repeat protein
MTSDNAVCSKVPAVQPLYFASKTFSMASKESVESPSLSGLPSELLTTCLVEYCDWGDLAKLACVQKSWSSLLWDAGNESRESKWELAQALLHGTHGLEVNPVLAMTLLEDLAGLELVEGEELDTFDYQVQVGKEMSAPAMKCLADCYLEDEEEVSRGMAWLKAAYELGNDLDAAHDLAHIYEYGNGFVSLDVYAAAEWFLKAAQGGHVEAMAEYAMCCELGCGCPQDDHEALEWYMKAATRGHVTSNYSVGEAFEEARGVPQSDEEACLWYYKAAVMGDDGSKLALRRLRDIARIVVPGVHTIIGS